MSRSRGGQDVGYPVARRDANAGWISVEFYPCRTHTHANVCRGDGRAHGPDCAVLAGCYLDVRLEDLAGLDTRGVVVLLAGAISQSIPRTDWRRGGLGGPMMPQDYNVPLPGL